MKSTFFGLVVLVCLPWSSRGQINQVLVLDGCTDWLEVSDNDLLDYDEALTIECWIRPNCQEGNNVFLSKQWCDGEFAYYLSINEGRLFWSSSSIGFCSSVNHHQTASLEVDAGVFTHVALVHTESQIRLYINGLLANSVQSQGTFDDILNSTEPLRIGAYQNVVGVMTNHFSGLIDELRIWNIEVQPDLIQQRMQQPLSGNEAGLVLYMNMEEEGLGADLVLRNSSPLGSSLNARAVGFTSSSPYIIEHETYDEKPLLGEDVYTCTFPITLEVPDDDYKRIVWSSGAVATSIQVTSPGTYAVTVETEQCKLYEDEIVVELASTPEVNRVVSICENDFLEINGTLVSEEGVYVDTLRADLGDCDTIRTTELRVITVNDGFFEIETCGDTQVVFLGEQLLAGTVQTFTLATEQGCDSFLTVEVLQVETFVDSVIYSACPEDFIAIDGMLLGPGAEETFFYTSAAGCDSSVTVLVQSLAVEESYLGEDIAVCDTEYILQSPVSNTLWNSQVVSQDFLVMSSGLYTAVFVDEAGCNNIDSVMVEFLEVPFVSIDVSLCEGDFILIDGTEYAEEGTFEFMVPSSGLGCDTLAEYSISIIPTVFDSMVLQTCENTTITFEDEELSPGEVRAFLFTSSTGCDSILIVEVESLAANIEEVQLRACFDGFVEFDSTLLRPNSETVFSYTNSAGCDSTVTVLVEEIPQDQYFLGPDTSICALSYTLVGPVSNTLWDGLSVNPTLVVDASGNYSAVYIDSLGCTHTDEVEVRLVDRKLYMPNVFSPDGDGNNDCFGPLFSEDYPIVNYSFRVYSRWGEKVFDTTFSDICWDGTFKGAQLNAGVFVWIIEGADTLCGTSILLTGDVTLLR